MGWYKFLDIFFIVFHTVFTLFNIVGWIFRRTRKLHLLTILLTALSWFVLGIWYGWGYCVCTHWHWLVREHLGYSTPSNSYIHFLIYEITGANLNEEMVQKATLYVFLFTFVMSVWLNV